MTELNKLKRMAKSAYLWRGHNMSKWSDNVDKTKSNSQCLKCDRYVMVNTHPSPNDITISGEAIALNCHDK